MASVSQRKLLDCTSCDAIVKPPTKFCSAGHIFCNDCFNKVTAECPLCRRALPRSQSNHFVDKLLPKLTLACRNSDKGCEKVLRLDLLSDHEEFCPRYPIKCVFGNSVKECAPEEFIEHVRSKHGHHLHSCTRMEAEEEDFCYTYDMSSGKNDDLFMMVLYYEEENLCFLYWLCVDSDERKRFRIQIFSFPQINGSEKFLYRVRIGQGHGVGFVYHGITQIYKPDADCCYDMTEPCKNVIKYEDVFLEPSVVNKVNISVQLRRIKAA